MSIQGFRDWRMSWGWLRTWIDLWDLSGIAIAIIAFSFFWGGNPDLGSVVVAILIVHLVRRKDVQ